MKKLAVFVEGLTEQLFVQRLIEEVASRNRLAVELELIKGKGGTNFPRRFIRLQATSPQGAHYYVLICDCSGDSSVVSDVINQYPTLVRAGYSQVIGLRDVFPKQAPDAPAMLAAMNRVLPNGIVPAEVLLAITEIEAWFLADETHFQRIDAGLKAEMVAQKLGKPLEEIDFEGIAHPSETLDQIYQIVGKRYTKQRNRIERAIEALDYSFIYQHASRRIPTLKRLCDKLGEFLI